MEGAEWPGFGWAILLFAARKNGSSVQAQAHLR
jgi:hypothetical protein